MYILQEIPIYLKYIYKILGIIQFSSRKKNGFSRIAPHLWPVPVNFLFFYLCVKYNTVVFNLHFMGIFKYVDMLATTSSTISMVISTTVFYSRSTQLKLLLAELEQLQIHPTLIFMSPPKHDNWLRKFLIFSLIINMMFFPFMEEPIYMSIYYSLPGIINFFDHLFLSHILDHISHKFDSINRDVKHRINLVGFLKVFADQDELNMNIKRVQSLTHLRYDLVDLTVRIYRHFEMTTVAAMVSWFGYVNDTIYYIIYVVTNDINRNNLIFYGNNVVFLMFSFCWLVFILRMFTRTQDKVEVKSGKTCFDKMDF